MFIQKYIKYLVLKYKSRSNEGGTTVGVKNGLMILLYVRIQNKK